MITEMKGPEFDRSDLAAEIAARIVAHDGDGLYQKFTSDDVLDIIQRFGEVLAEALAEYSRVEIHEIGVFSLEHRADREGVTPGGESWETPERKKVEFDAAPALASAIAAITESPVY